MTRGVRGWIVVGTVMALAMTIGPAAMAARNTAVSERASVPGQSVGSATARCPQGDTAVGAGFQSPGFTPDDSESTAARTSSALIDQRRAETKAFNFGAQPGDIVSWAYCRRSAPPPDVRSRTASVLPGAVGSAVAECPPGTGVTGGGFEGVVDLTGGAAIVVLTSMRQSPRKWLVQGANFGGAAGDLTAHAYCRRPAPGLVTRSEDAEASGTATNAVTVACPDGGRAIAGGFDGHPSIDGGNLHAAAAVTSKRADRRTSWRTVAVGVNVQTGPITAYAYCKT
jgi:hypothetical protein